MALPPRGEAKSGHRADVFFRRAGARAGAAAGGAAAPPHGGMGSAVSDGAGGGLLQRLREGNRAGRREGCSSAAAGHEGIEVKDIKLYHKLKSDDVGIFEEILETSQEVTKYNLTTDRIVCKDDAIYLYIGNICVNLGENVSSEQIAQIEPIIEKLGDQPGTLHLENYS